MKKKSKKLRQLRKELADERHARILAELLYNRAVDELASRPKVGFNKEG